MYGSMRIKFIEIIVIRKFKPLLDISKYFSIRDLAGASIFQYCR